MQDGGSDDVWHWPSVLSVLICAVNCMHVRGVSTQDRNKRSDKESVCSCTDLKVLLIRLLTSNSPLEQRMVLEPRCVRSFLNEKTSAGSSCCSTSSQLNRGRSRVRQCEENIAEKRKRKEQKWMTLIYRCSLQQATREPAISILQVIHWGVCTQYTPYVQSTQTTTFLDRTYAWHFSSSLFFYNVNNLSPLNHLPLTFLY